MTVSGIIKKIRFRNDENGYTIMQIEPENAPALWVVGCFPDVQAEISVTLIGEYTEHPSYGRQFSATEIAYNAPTDREGIINYLASGLFRGIGEKVAREMVAVFGAATLEVLENNPERLTRIKGIGKATLAKISEDFKKHKEMQSVILFFQKHGVPLSKAIKIYNAYKDKALDVVKDNPYKLIEDIDGFGFKTADTIAVKIGFSSNLLYRCQAGVVYTIENEAQTNSHTYVPYSVIIEKAAALLSCTEDEVSEAVLVLERSGKIVRISREGKEVGFALRMFFSAEKAIAYHLNRLNDGADMVSIVLENEIKAFEEQNKIFLNNKQYDAIETAISKGVMVITGGPGTGKTTITKCVREMLVARGLKCSLCAPTGRAAKRMAQASGDLQAQTIHRLLGATRVDDKYTYRYNEVEQLDTDVVICDEISMCDVFIFSALLRAMPTGSHLIMVGDKDQLPSVQAGNILADVIAAGMFPVISLTEIYRQAEGSYIIDNAHRINNGLMPIIDNAHSKDFFFDCKENVNDIPAAVVSYVRDRLPGHFNVSWKDIQVLAPKKDGEAGIHNLNRTLQDALNGDPDLQVRIGEFEFRKGDRIMHAKNNYDLEWVTDGGFEEGKGVFNGDVGFITELSKSNFTVKFEDGKECIYKGAEKEEIIPAYAVSIHKSQGSEFPLVIVVLPPNMSFFAHRSMLYTAVTRAKSAVILVGSQKTLWRMIQNNQTAERFTVLLDLLRGNTVNGK
ncbi:MAG: ATP-dependent RecD-like DNA helicase [Christensenellaceae bacterium]|jgi:exodeoxyribonuclease V alpha subunit|nr:ATP-dependent RecD-like DNA helicase [Christensenellaceae bacterium]